MRMAMDDVSPPECELRCQPRSIWRLDWNGLRYSAFPVEAPIS